MSDSVVLIDTGPLVALLNPNDEYHDWARETTRRLPLPLITSEAVLTEVFHLFAHAGGLKSGPSERAQSSHYLANGDRTRQVRGLINWPCDYPTKC